MKKAIFLALLIILFPITVCAANGSFVIDTNSLSLGTSSKKNIITNSLNNNYKLSYSITTSEDLLTRKIKETSRKATILLLGNPNNSESSAEYYKRYQAYAALQYNPTIPKDATSSSGFDENSQEYKDDLVAEFTVVPMFFKFDELDIKYNTIGSIRVTKTNNDTIMGIVNIPNVTMKQQNKTDSFKYDKIKTNLIIYYFFKELKGNYKLYYLYGETGDDLDQYFSNLEGTETKNSMSIVDSYNSITSVYDYSKLNALSNDTLANIYNNNAKNIVSLNSYYNNLVISSANGFFINNGLVVTTWDFIEKSLVDAQYITINDNNLNFYDIDGIVTINPNSDIVVIKLKDKVTNKVTIGNYKDLKVEDPVISVSSKTGVGLNLQKGIIVSNDGYLKTLIPLTDADQGSPLFDSNGNVVGINTNKATNSSISIAINSGALKEIQNKFNKIDFATIKSITFNKLKSEYYYTKYNKEVVSNNISKNTWNNFKRIGKIEDNIKLKLVKANYNSGVVSLRYFNSISNYVSSMQLAINYRVELKKEGFKELVNSTKKCIYQNKNYKIIIMEEFNYLIIVMVKI